MSGILLKGGRVVDPVNGIDGTRDVLIDGGVIAAVGVDLPAGAAQVVDVGGLLVTPGLIDMHVHLREPGQEHKETIATGAASAVAGGFTAVACMPNTDPVNDQASVTQFMLKRAAEAGLARVYPIGAVTLGSKGEAAGRDRRPQGGRLRRDLGRRQAGADRAADAAGARVHVDVRHARDRPLRGPDAQGRRRRPRRVQRLAARACKGIPGEAEELWIERDITLAGLTGGRFHVAHLSTRGSLRAVRNGKARGIAVTCEVAPHHFILTDDALEGYDTNVKMNPPLREAADRDELIRGLVDGSVDVIATDHAPHHADEKRVEFDRAPFGIVGLETCVPLTFDRLVHPGLITLTRFVELLSVNPARILGVAGGALTPGAVADVSILAPDLGVTIDPARLVSKSKNTPFGGWSLKGGVAATIVGGRVVYTNPDVPRVRAFTSVSVA